MHVTAIKHSGTNIIFIIIVNTFINFTKGI